MQRDLSKDARRSVTLEPAELHQALPGFGVLQELKHEKHFSALRRDLGGDSTPALASNEVPSVVLRSLRGSQTSGAVQTSAVAVTSSHVQVVQEGPQRTELYRPLLLPDWARDLTAALEQTPLREAFPAASLRVRWLLGSTNIADCLQFLRDVDESGAVVFDDNQQAEGILELSDILRLVMTSPRPSYCDMLRPDCTRLWKVLDQRCDNALVRRGDDSWWLPAEFPASELLRSFGHGAWHVAVYSEGSTQLSRVVSQTALASYLLSKLDAKTTSLAKLKASSLSLVIPNVLFVRAETLAGLVFAALSHHRVSGAAIVSGSLRLVTQVSVTDFLPASKDCSLLDLPIIDYLKKTERFAEPVTCSPNVSVYELLQLFATNRTHRVFVVGPITRHLMGICTLSQLYKALSGATMETLPIMKMDGEAAKEVSQVLV